MAWALGRYEHNVNLCWRRDLVIVDRETVAEEQHVARCEPIDDFGVVDVVMTLVRKKNHHEVSLAGGIGNRHHLKPLGARISDAGRVFA